MENNNYENRHTTMQNAFFTKEEKEHFNELYTNLENGDVLEGMSFASLGVSTCLDVFYRIESNIDSLNINDDLKNYFKEQSKKILGFKNSLATTKIDKDKIFELRENSNRVKMIILDTLTQMVEEGAFNETQMETIENEVGILLNSINEVRISKDNERPFSQTLDDRSM